MWAVRTSSCAVFFCEKKKARSLWDNTQTNRWWGFSLTDHTDLTEHICALFRTHRTPPAYRIHRTFQLKVAVTFCEIGWLNVSVECCVFCSSVFSVRKRTIVKLAGEVFSHRTHRFNRIFLRTVSRPQNASGIQISQSVKTIVDTNKGQYKADILLIGVSRWSLPFPPGEGSGEGPLSLWAFVCSVLLCKSVRNRSHPLYEIAHKQLAGEVFLSQRRKSVTAMLGDDFWERGEFIGW